MSAIAGTGRKRTRFFHVATPYLFVAAAVGLLILLTYLPAANMLWYSLTEWRGFGAISAEDFVGLDNYIKVFTDPSIFEVFLVSVYYFVGSFLQMGAALYFATILSFSTKFTNFFRGVIFFPYLLNGVAIGFVFLYFFQPGELSTRCWDGWVSRSRRCGWATPRWRTTRSRRHPSGDTQG